MWQLAWFSWGVWGVSRGGRQVSSGKCSKIAILGSWLTQWGAFSTNVRTWVQILTSHARSPAWCCAPVIPAQGGGKKGSLDGQPGKLRLMQTPDTSPWSLRACVYALTHTCTWLLPHTVTGHSCFCRTRFLTWREPQLPPLGSVCKSERGLGWVWKVVETLRLASKDLILTLP